MKIKATYFFIYLGLGYLTLHYPIQAQTMLEKANWLYEDHNYVEAAHEFQQIHDKIKKPELKAEVLYKIGICYYQQWKLTEAAKWLNQAIEAGYRSGDAFIKLGILLFTTEITKPPRLIICKALTPIVSVLFCWNPA